MRFSTKALIGVAMVAIGIVLVWRAITPLNERQTAGQLRLSGLTAPVRVMRDGNAMPYIYAANLSDAFIAQGFVTGQDRLFQVEVAKRAATGRLAEVFGRGPNDVVLKLDREARVIGFHRLAEQQATALSATVRNRLQAYIDGLNAYITTRSATHPVEFRLAGFEPEPWTIEDLLAIVFYLGWGSAANFDAELVAHQVIQRIGPDAFAEIAPLVVNPDVAEQTGVADTVQHNTERWTGSSHPLAAWTDGGVRQFGLGGSNNWALSGARAGQTAAIVTNDPHLDSRNLPGPWHPVGLFTPDLRVVGVSAGLPGVTIGRNQYIAFGVTNAYADTVDLYVETVDPRNPDNYLEGDQSLPFTTLIEPIRVLDSEADGGFVTETLTVKSTKRGPVISDNDSSTVTNTVLSLRWASAEFIGPELGVDRLMNARNVTEALAAIEATGIISLNFVVGDTDGRVARRASGAAPVRLRGDGMAPFVVRDGNDNWAGRIPADEMPGEIDPARGWTGSANHFTAPDDYPYLYTTYASPDFRYRRIRELLSSGTISADAAWRAQYDTVNVFARDTVPILLGALSTVETTELRDLASILDDWDFQDDADAVAPTIFQEIIRQLAQLTFTDELGDEAAAAYLSNWYVWQQRFDKMLSEGNSKWFDDKRTPEIEDLPALIRRAGLAALERLTETYGTDRSAWRWGDVHRIEFSGPLRREGLVGQLTGNRSVRMAGSGETLLRTLYPYDEPFHSKWFASLRMTADLADTEKVRAVLPGGAVGRTLHPHLDDQIDPWSRTDAAVYWWFSDEAIETNARQTLTLVPN
ncbi:MAG: penicillin acylase family protein [Pseudomonadota bacterium]